MPQGECGASQAAQPSVGGRSAGRHEVQGNGWRHTHRRRGWRRPPCTYRCLTSPAVPLSANEQAATAVTRACQMPRVATMQRAGAQLQSVARISSGAAALRRQQGASMGSASRLAVVRAMATANGPVTTKVR